eukprot:CAMPEP_0179410274 /NCGR_PEP_ID=MMETSP0799-20121207/3191_1 /TAXON_ID=46947 /ORGANISM="Geminigera cryophila, Strain CCMP2564" /LENGTH=46 /DNA_ID= /DNA_START= /DNA_END= /DNA_ORIENTATION=
MCGGEIVGYSVDAGMRALPLGVQLSCRSSNVENFKRVVGWGKKVAG